MKHKTQKQKAKDWFKLVEFCYRLGFTFNSNDSTTGKENILAFVASLADAQQDLMNSRN